MSEPTIVCDAHKYDETSAMGDGVYETLCLDSSWDGCVHISGHRAATREGYLHVCDLDAFIRTLVDFRNRAAEHYQVHGKDWPTTMLRLEEDTDESEQPVPGTFGETVFASGTSAPGDAPLKRVLLGR